MEGQRDYQLPSRTTLSVRTVEIADLPPKTGQRDRNGHDVWFIGLGDG